MVNTGAKEQRQRTGNDVGVRLSCPLKPEIIESETGLLAPREPVCQHANAAGYELVCFTIVVRVWQKVFVSRTTLNFHDDRSKELQKLRRGELYCCLHKILNLKGKNTLNIEARLCYGCCSSELSYCIEAEMVKVWHGFLSAKS